MANATLLSTKDSMIVAVHQVQRLPSSRWQIGVMRDTRGSNVECMMKVYGQLYFLRISSCLSPSLYTSLPRMEERIGRAVQLALSTRPLYHQTNSYKLVAGKLSNKSNFS